MRVTLDSLLPLNEPQRPPTDHNTDTNVSAPATVQSISHCLRRYMDVAVFLVLEHWLYSYKMPEFEDAWHRAKPTVVNNTLCHKCHTLRPKVTEGLKEIL